MITCDEGFILPGQRTSMEIACVSDGSEYPSATWTVDQLACGRESRALWNTNISQWLADPCVHENVIVRYLNFASLPLISQKHSY